MGAVAEPFGVAPSPIPAHQTGHADFLIRLSDWLIVRPTAVIQRQNAEIPNASQSARLQKLSRLCKIYVATDSGSATGMLESGP
jgi:hypothetical protein